MAFSPRQPSQGPGGFISGGQSQARFGPLKNSIYPVTIRCLKTMTDTTADNSLTLFGEKVEKVMLLGQILEVEETETAISFLLDDGTGTCWMQIWLDAGNNNIQTNKNASEIDNVKKWIAHKILPYVKCYGTWANYQFATQSTRVHSLTLYRIRCITSFNEVAYHNMRVCEFLHYKSSLNNPLGTQANVQNLELQTQTDFTNDQKLVIDFLKAQRDRPEGVPVDEIVGNLENRVERSEILKILTDFQEEGLVYTGLDEEHFAWCDE